MTTTPTVAFFVMEDDTHFRRCLTVIDGLVAGGLDVVVFTEAANAPAVEATGARFADLYADGSVADADDHSFPPPVRFVTFAGRFADAVIERVRAYGPDLIAGDSFAIIARPVAAALGLPYVMVCSGHNYRADQVLPIVRVLPYNDIADVCHAAVATLRDRFGIADASPFSFTAPPSADLNLCCEPPQFLTEDDHAAWDPVAFFGSVREGPDGAGATSPSFGDGRRKLYVSFGTTVQRYFADAYDAAVRTIVDAVAARPELSVLVSLGEPDVAPEVLRSLERPNVRVATYVDQRAVLAEADAFLTHHGVNGTHEAVYHEVPMISYPFAWDQPGLAARCQALGLAVPLATEPQAPLDAGMVHAALDRFDAEESHLRARLAEASTWEVDVMQGRPAVVERIAALIG